jgi:hypothetical protein
VTNRHDTIVDESVLPSSCPVDRFGMRIHKRLPFFRQNGQGGKSRAEQVFQYVQADFRWNYIEQVRHTPTRANVGYIKTLDN